MNKSLEVYLQQCEVIDWQNSNILELAKKLKQGHREDWSIAEQCFVYVRDIIRHTADYKLDTITCKASDVLTHKTGYCYAKSHLLAALLRANEIPTGFCYQRLSVGESGAPYCLHGLNAVYLKDTGWYRIDARGNKAGVDAQFTPPMEKLAFIINDKYEADLQGIWPEPHIIVTSALNRYPNRLMFHKNLPDIPLFPII